MKLLLDESKFHGHMANPTAAHTNPPRLMVMKRGSRAVMSVPAATELAAIFVPSWARIKAAAMKKTPTRLAEPPSFRNEVSNSRGFQIGSPPKITTDDEDTIIPMKQVTPKPMGIVRSWDHLTSLGFLAKRLKSSEFTISAAKFEIEAMIPLMIPQASSLS